MIVSISNALFIAYGRILCNKWTIPKMALHNGISSNVRRINVAICGSGIAGSMAAYVLSKDSRFAVTVFEAGRGPGGRTSTRRAGDFVFDHGAQYISYPKDKNFLPIFSDWRNKNIISQWDGIFATVQTSTTDIKYSDPSAPKYVGYPHMNSICKYLLSSANIDTNNNELPISCAFGQRIRAEPILSGSDDLSSSPNFVDTGPGNFPGPGSESGDFGWTNSGRKAGSSESPPRPLSSLSIKEPSEAFSGNGVVDLSSG
jgi:hypothetical protein